MFDLVVVEHITIMAWLLFCSDGNGIITAAASAHKRTAERREPSTRWTHTVCAKREQMKDEIERLEQVYGGVGVDLSAQIERYHRGLNAFVARYGPGEVTAFRAPGRVNLIGEHTDYHHGYVLPVALDRDILLFARRRADARVRLANVEPEFGDRAFTISTSIPMQPVGDWANYIQGAAQLLEQECGPGLRGMDVLVDGAPPLGVPRGAGLSSSSALTVAAAVALAELNGLPLEGAELAERCSRAEWYVGTRGGVMDHFASLLSRRDHALLLDCRPGPDGYAHGHVPLPPGHAVMVVDSGVRHRNTGPHYNRRVAEGRIGIHLLRARYAGITRRSPLCCGK